MKKNDGNVYQNFLNKQKKIKPKLQVNDLLRTAVLKKSFSKGETSNWSYKLFKITEIIIGTTPIHRFDILPERYNKALLKKTELTLKENKDVMKTLNST